MVTLSTPMKPPIKRSFCKISCVILLVLSLCCNTTLSAQKVVQDTGFIDYDAVVVHSPWTWIAASIVLILLLTVVFRKGRK